MAMISTLNVPEIKRVFRHIEEDVRRLDMSIWGRTEYWDEKWLRKLFGYNKDNFPDCGTQACFAGWTLLLNKRPMESTGAHFTSSEGRHVADVAAEILGVDMHQRCLLFFSNGYKAQEAQLEGLRRNINLVFEQAGILDRV